LIKREVVPAVGCTEPAAVALCVAKAVELLEAEPDSISVRLSANILKNAMGVGIPGTGMIGLPIAIALGATIGKSEYGLEVLQDVTPEAVEAAKRFIDEKEISIKLFEDAPNVLHIDVEVSHDTDRVRATISRTHTNFVYLERNRNIIFNENPGSEPAADAEAAGRPAGDAPAPAAAEENDDERLDLLTVWNFATQTPLEDIKFILQARDLNLEAARIGLAEEWGHSLGSTMAGRGKIFFGDTPAAKIISWTSAACDARMGGAPIPVMSNSGSGNQGICATMPVVAYADSISATEEQLIRALTLSHLTSIYIKQSLGRLSALCGCVVASTGAAAGLVYLMDGEYDEVANAVKNMVANLTGMLCDGAKPSCAMKISSGVSTALMSAMLATEGHAATSAEGIIDEDVDRTIRNLTSIGREAMRATDLYVLDIMTCK
ncbi:MAG: L-serine ammonia-lyase, iron-sulfur-dependent, subunit alpha, partial [Muribaculaceae bacterium]|nr:L-serine ammonia-lyase, iron-sulfur-dependent, subunit alpha [Muribaculaceae bacterium]